ncbi:DUF1641 domain-containing protein [Halobacteriaceae archaeon GCM10025711]
MNEQVEEQEVGPEERDVLEEAIAENPEEVARLFERLGMVNELLDGLDVAMSAADDEMVKGMAGMATPLAEAANGAATYETVRLAESVGENGGDLAEAMDTVVRLQQDGTLEELAEFADLLVFLKGALDDEAIQKFGRLGGNVGELADTAGDPDTVRGLNALLQSVGDASGGDEPPKKVGMLGMVGALRDDDVQVGLGYLIGISKALGQNLQR